MSKQVLIPDKHYYYNADGNMVFTQEYHLLRGYCCGCGCKHCPYHYQNVPEPKRSQLLKKHDNN